MTIRSDIEKDRILRRQKKPVRTYKADGLRAREVHATKVIYCKQCKGPVADTERAREAHVALKPLCREAMKL
jgi:hypothetical protein